MDSIFHEKQEGSLCAQHCLNSLLQGPYFTAVDLSVLGETLDEEERLRMAECGEESEEYQNFLKQPSGNMDDSGYFSIQVISRALEVWGLELVPYNSADARVKDCDPGHQQAFICNYQNHWFTIRKMGLRWFNLNSLLSKPALVSDTYLVLFLAQLRNEGYAIFVVFGELPQCGADNIDEVIVADSRGDGTWRNDAARRIPEDSELEAAVRLSLSQELEDRSEEEELQRALMLSLTCESEDETLRRAILMSMENA